MPSVCHRLRWPSQQKQSQPRSRSDRNSAMRERKAITVDEELKKNPQLRMEDIETMREWVTAEFPLPSITDVMLVWFLHCSDYDIEVAKSTLVKYYNVLYSCPQMFLYRDPSSEEIRQITRAIGIAILDGRDKDGNIVLTQRIQDTTPSLYDMDVSLKYVVMVCAAWQREHGTAPGLVLVYDQAGFSLGHMARGSLSTVRTMVHFVQDCAPFNVRGIHVVNTNAIFEAILGFFKPFMRSSLFSQIRSYREGNIEGLYEHVPKEILPKDYGGNQASAAELSERQLQDLMYYKDYFEEEDKKAFAEMDQWRKMQPEGLLGRIASWFRPGNN